MRPTPILKTRPCAICGQPIVLRYPRGNQRVHAGDCLVEHLQRKVPVYHPQRQRKEAP